MHVIYLFFGFKKIKNISHAGFIKATYFPGVIRKSILLLWMGQLAFFSPYAQTSNVHRREDLDVREFHVRTISIDEPGEKLQLVNFSGIQVIDARPDSSKIGFMQKRIIHPVSSVVNKAIAVDKTEQRIKRMPFFLALDNGVQYAAAQYAKSYLQFSQNDTLPHILMVIKELWLSDELNLDDSIPNNEKVLRAENLDRWTSGIDVKMEFYLKDKSACYALYRYDSLISETKTVSEYGPGFIKQALRLSLQKMVQMDSKISSIINRHAFTLQEIIAHNNSEYNIPILQDKSLKPGVYMTFAEFKNNNPLLINYELKNNNLADLLYIKQTDGLDYLERNAWGYCNGKNAFIKAGDNFFLLQRMENAFYIFGAKNIKRHHEHAIPLPLGGLAGGITNSLINYRNSKWELPLRPYRLGWSTGDLY